MTVTLEPADVDAPEPDVSTGGGARVGYARVSTAGQLLDRQIAALTAAGCIRVFADKKSGKNAEREELWKALDYLRPGDALVVVSLDRPGRSLGDLISIVTGLRRRGAGKSSRTVAHAGVRLWRSPGSDPCARGQVRCPLSALPQ
jgi:Resolvase, N terminal domain